MKRLAALALATLVACTVEEPKPMAVPGVYDLVSVNGAMLPVVEYAVPPEVWQTTAAMISLADDGAFASSIHWTVVTSYPTFTSRNDSSRSAGYWTRSDSTLSVATERETFTLTMHTDGSITRFWPRSELKGPYLDVTYRYVRR